MMRKIGIIARSLGLYHGGVYRYVFNILYELDKKVKEQPIEIVIVHNEAVLRGKFPHCREIYTPLPHTYGARLLFDYVYSVSALKQAGLDYIIYPKNIIPASHYILQAKKLPTILDLGHFEKGLHAYQLWDTLYARALMKASCRQAYKILTISHSTKQTIIEKLKISPEKIQVVHLGIEQTFQRTHNHDRIVQKFRLRKPFIFYNGSITPRKNLMRVLEAFHDIQDQIPHTFYLTGSLTWGADHIHTYIEKNLDGRVVKLGYIEEDELIALYNLAELFLYPSLYEGFGLPILEAQACGCPVLTSKVTSCPEVAGGAAHLVNPYIVDEIKAGMLKILHDDDYRQQLIRRGFENITRFHWQKTAEDILAACH